MHLFRDCYRQLVFSIKFIGMDKIYKNSLFFLAVFYILLSFPLAAQEKWENWTNGDHVTDIQEIDNEVWVTTKGGLVIYDTHTGQKTFMNPLNSALPSNRVEAIAVDADKDPWIGTYDAGIIARKGGKWISFNTDNSSLSSNVIYEIVQDGNGNMLIGTNNGLEIYDGQDFTQHHLPVYEGVNTIIPRPGNKLIVGWGYYSHVPSRIYHYDGQQFTLDTAFVKTGLYRMYGDAQGDIWACHGSGVSQFDGNSWKHFDSTNSVLPNARTYSFMEENGEIYLGTGAGVYLYKNNQWVEMPGSENVPVQEISYVTRLADGDLWLGSLENSVAVNNGQEWEHLEMSNSNLNGNAVVHLADGPNGEIYLSSAFRDFMQHYDQGRWGEFSLPENEFFVSGTATVDGQGNFYIADHDEEIWKFDGSQWTNTQLPNYPVSFSIRKMAFDKDGNMWVGTYNNGLLKFDGKNWVHWTMANSNLNTDNVTPEMIDPHGNLWLSLTPYYNNSTQQYYGGGLAKFDGNSFAVYDTSNSPMPGNYASNLVWANDQIYFLSNGEILGFDGTDWQNFSFAGGTAPLNSYLLAVDNDDRLLATGYHTYNVTTLAVMDENGWSIVKDSLPFKYNQVFEMLVDGQNTLWFSTNGDGIVRYNRDGLPGQNTAIGHEGITTSGWNIYPVPANDRVTVSFGLEEASIVDIDLLDMHGRTVASFPSFSLGAGSHQQEINLAALNTGTYFVRMKAGDRYFVRKIVKAGF